MFIRLIQMSIVPLVMASVIVATGSMTGSGMGKMAGRTFGWTLTFSAVAALVGWLLSVLIRPGEGMEYTGQIDSEIDEAAKEASSWQDSLLGFVSTNVVEAMASADMLPIIVFSLLFGVSLNAYTRVTGNTLVVTFLEQVQQVVLGMIRMVMRIAPIGVFCLLAALAGDVGFAVASTALSFLGTVLIGVILVLLLAVVVVAIRTRLNPWLLWGKLAEQTMIAITTTSSAVTFPTVLKTARERIGVSPPVANFTLSVGLTMGSWGACLSNMVVIMFLAQAGGIELSFGQIVLGVCLAVLLNMGTISVPGGFAVAGMFLATSLGLPVEALGLLIAVDWFTGILRTFLNVNGDTMVAMLVANATDEIDRDVYYGKKTVSVEASVDGADGADSFDNADGGEATDDGDAPQGPDPAR